jgi:transcriptional regulator with XRE-family HTH domain
VTLYERAVSLVAAEMDSQGVSQRELAERLGTTEPWVSILLHRQKNTSLKTLERVAATLDASFDLVLRRN